VFIFFLNMFLSPLLHVSRLNVGNLSGKFVWGALDDVVMGGVSESAFQIQPTGSETGEATGLFKGDLFSLCLLVYKV
jgi:hypothetical protein